MKRACLLFCAVIVSMWFSACGGVNTGSSNSNGSPTPGASNPGPASGGSGSSTAALAYVSGGNNNFYGIRVDSTSAVSTVTGSPYSLPAPAMSFAATGNLLFVSSPSAPGTSSSGLVTSYRADANGALTQLASNAVASNGGITITLDASGKFLYGTASATPAGQSSFSPAIFGFSVDQNSGTLSALSGSPWILQSGMGPAMKPLVTPNGSWVCITMELARTNEGAQCIPRHSDGTLDPNNFVQPAASTTGIPGVAATADGTHLLYTNGGQNQVISTLISSTSNGVAASSGGSVANGVAVNPAGSWGAVTNLQSNNLEIFEIGAGGGSLAPMTPVSTTVSPDQVAFSRSGDYIFVTSSSGTVVFSFNRSNGLLTPLNASSPAPGAGGPVGTM